MKEDVVSRSVLGTIKEKHDIMFSAEKKVADFILSNQYKAVDSNVSELAKLSGVSDATVVRMCHHLGYTGYYQLRLSLAKDLGKIQYKNESAASPEAKGAVEQVFSEYAEAMYAIGLRLDDDVMWNCVQLIKNCNVAHIMATGNTSPLAQYMGFRLGRLAIKATYNVAPEYFMNHVNLASPDDILIAISQSGTSRRVIQGLELGKEKGLKSIAITAFAQSPVSALADYVLVSAGKNEPFSYYKGYAHLNETAVIDALLNFVLTEEAIKKVNADRTEILLSDDKL